MENIDQVLVKHFTDVPNRAFPPGKPTQIEKPSASKIKEVLETYWTTTKAPYYNTFNTGKLLTNAKDLKSPVDILPVLSDLIVQGIKLSNLKGEISNEKLSQYFSGLVLLFQMLETNIKELFEQAAKKQPADQPQAKMPEFDTTELLAILCGFLVAKLND